MWFFNAQRFTPARYAKAVFANDALRFAPRLCQTRAIEPNIEAAGFFGGVAQLLSPDVSGVPVLSAARAAKGEFSKDLRGRGALPAE